MRTTGVFPDLESHDFKSSPESCSGNSCYTDSTDRNSEVDFIRQFQFDELNDPMLVDPVDCDLSHLTSYLDEAANDVLLTGIDLSFTIPKRSEDHFKDLNKYMEWDGDEEPFEQNYNSPDLIKSESSDTCSSLGSFKSHSPVQPSEDEQLSPVSPKTVGSNQNFSGKLIQLTPPQQKLPRNILQNTPLNCNLKLDQFKAENLDTCNSELFKLQAVEDEKLQFLEVEKHEPLSPNPQVIINNNCQNQLINNNNCQNFNGKLVQTSPIQEKVAIRKLQQVSCASNKSPKNKILLINRADLKPNATVPSTPASQVVVKRVVKLENVTPVVPISRVIPTPVVPSTQPMLFKRNQEKVMVLNLNNIDPKILKRQQRKIKNRESACLSRKKKKDYLTSLENQVKELSFENQTLKQENSVLKQQLNWYEESFSKKSGKTIKSIMLCMMFFTVGFHWDIVRNPFLVRNSVGLVKTNTPKLDHHGRNLLWSPEEVSEKNQSNFSPLSMCPAAINQTESARLVLELERWIGRPFEIPSTNAVNSSNVTEMKQRNVKIRKISRKRKQKKYETPLVSSMYELSSASSNGQNNREIQVFSPTPEQLYSEFFEAINRQDDTFYVVSFSDHHMLLPALYHNKTRRPKMSLIMPSVLPNKANSTKLIPLMQIDCEVLDTRLIKVQYGSIPQHLRSQGNSSDYQGSDAKSSDTTPSNYTAKKAYKPYFMKKNSIKSDSSEIYNMR